MTQPGLRAQNQTAELKLRAERRAGELLAGLKLRGGDRKSNGHRGRLKLGDLGITQGQSKRWQKEASLPEEEFESFLGQANRLAVGISSASLIRLASRRRGNGDSGQHETDPMPPEHSDRRPESPFSDVLETIAELKGHHDALANLLDPAGSDPSLEPGAECLVLRYLSEIGECVTRLERLLS